jgi:hypothetical protein
VNQVTTARASSKPSLQRSLAIESLTEDIGDHTKVDDDEPSTNAEAAPTASVTQTAVDVEDEKSVVPSSSSSGSCSSSASPSAASSPDSAAQQELLEFIRQTMSKSVKDKNIILRIETDLIQLVKDQA